MVRVGTFELGRSQVRELIHSVDRTAWRVGAIQEGVPLQTGPEGGKPLRQLLVAMVDLTEVL